MTDLHTARLTLHAIDAAEGARIVAAQPGPDDVWAEDFPFEGDLMGVKMFLMREDRAPFGHYVIVRQTDGQAIGGIGFKGAPVDGSAEIGYGLVPSARGQGYAAEAAAALLQLAAAEGVARVVADTTRDNTASRRTLERAGFHLTGSHHEVYFYEAVLA